MGSFRNQLLEAAAGKTTVKDAFIKSMKEDTCEPDDNGACPEGYTKGDDGKCHKSGDGDDKDMDKGDKKPPMESKAKTEDVPAFLKDKDGKDGDGDDKDDDDDKKDKDGDDDDSDDKDKDESSYRERVSGLIDSVMGGQPARQAVFSEFAAE